jgi:FkbM family methyltransferase
VVTVEGAVLHLDPGDDLGLARGRAYEPLLRQMMERHIPRGGTVVDGGAHIGYHTVLAARLVGSAGRVIAFEPAPSTYALLVENIAQNGYENVILLQAALADVSGRGALHLSPTWSGDHRIAATPSRAEVEIELVSLDQYLPEGDHLDFIKLDIQGAEPLALKGATNVLGRSPQLVAAIEYDPSALPLSNEPGGFLDDLFSRFRTVLDVNDEIGSVMPTTPELLLSSYTRENARHTNLLCLNR